jgi:hypothetical protein
MQTLGAGMRSRMSLLVCAAAISLSAPVVPGQCNVVNGKAYGDCQNVTVNVGDAPEVASLDVRTSVVAANIIKGATIHPGGALTLTGISQGDIVVHRGGRLKVSGTVDGTVRNDGGHVEITGIVAHLISSGGTVTVRGIVKRHGGSGPITFTKNSVLAERAFPAETSVP